MKKYLRFLRGRLIFARNFYWPKIVRRSDVKYYGTEYGGWPVIEKLMDSDCVVLSFGLGEDISFDLGVIDSFNCRVIGFDPTPKSVQWLAKQSLPEQFEFINVGLAGETGTITFNAPENPEYASYSATHEFSTSGTDNQKKIVLPVKDLNTLVSELSLERIDVLKMDIEGSENEVIESLKDSAIRPIQILVEFHHRIHGTGFARTKAALDTLESMGYRLFHISDLGDEFSLVLEEALG